MLDNYLIIHKSILPDYYEKVLEVRRLMESGQAQDISQAVKQAGISRSTYYKYRDFIIEPSSVSLGRKAVLSMLLAHETGVLSALLSCISAWGASVVTITQSPPIHDAASVTITIDLSSVSGSLTELMDGMRGIAGVDKLKLVAVE